MRLGFQFLINTVLATIRGFKTSTLLFINYLVTITTLLLQSGVSIAKVIVLYTLNLEASLLEAYL